MPYAARRVRPDPATGDSKRKRPAPKGGGAFRNRSIRKCRSKTLASPPAARRTALQPLAERRPSGVYYLNTDCTRLRVRRETELVPPR